MGDAPIARDRLLAVAQDTGGANAIVPVVISWLATGAAASSVATGLAIDVFETRGLVTSRPSVRGTDMAAMRRAAADILDRERPDIVLAGTSWGPAIDKAMIAEATHRHIPTLAVIDTWGYYRERFSDVERISDALPYLPDRVAIMDEFGREEAVRGGIPASRLVVTGQPHFDDFRDRIGRVRDEADRLRRSVDANRPIVMFASERLAHDFGVGTPWYRGYTEREAWVGLRAASSRLATPVTLVVKLHPQEERWIADDEAIVWQGVPPLTAIGAADVIVGMTSTLLFEAALAGKPAISFQPGARAEINTVTLRLGLMRLTRTEAELEAALVDAVRDPAAMIVDASSWNHRHAAVRVVEELKAMFALKSEAVR